MKIDDKFSISDISMVHKRPKCIKIHVRFPQNQKSPRVPPKLPKSGLPTPSEPGENLIWNLMWFWEFHIGDGWSKTKIWQNPRKISQIFKNLSNNSKTGQSTTPNSFWARRKVDSKSGPKSIYFLNFCPIFQENALLLRETTHID